MKKFLISIFTFLVAMLPLGLLSSSNDNANSADVNHDGEVNISDVNAVIDIILGGAHEGYSGDVNNDGETNISDINYLIDIILGTQTTAVPVINTQIVDNAVIITASGNGNVCLYVNGVMVTNPYVAIRGEVDYEVSVYATAKEDGKLMSQSETINILIPALATTATPVITTETTNEAVIITASGNGNVCLYVNGVVVDNPYVAVRGEVDYEVSVYATAQESGKLMSQSETINVLIPELATTATPVITTETTNGAVIITASGDGVVQLYVNDLLVNNPYIAIRSTVDYVITVYATAQEEGKLMSQCESINVLVPAMPITATPVVTTNITDDAVIITATGDGIVKLYVNDLLVENPYTAIRSNVDYELTVYATAQEEGKVLSQSNNQTIIVPALENNETETFTVNGVSFKMVVVEGGTFTMGATPEQGEDAYDNEKPAHQVTLSSFSIGETEVTQELWQAVMGSNPSDFTGNLQRPVECVSWNDCQTFISRLNQLTGKTFRLPTEAEWEFAARGGTKSQGYKYAGSNTIGDVAWYYNNSYALGSGSPNYGTHAVATKYPNELGLYDLSGNVYEWVHDWYGSYTSDAQTNPSGPASGWYRVSRGGSWINNDVYCRVSHRDIITPETTNHGIGLRLALGPDISEQHEWVDLGLPSGTLWATCNVGASAPEECGDYFAWGETEPKDMYDWSTYKWCNGYYETLTKYCTKSSEGYNGFVDNKAELDPEDDAAYVNWGENWRIPTYGQFDELKTKCTWTWTTQNGVNGHLVTGPNGNSLFLPAAGYRYDSSLHGADLWVYYWSRTLYSSHPDDAYNLYFNSGNVRWSYDNRKFGFAVRAVRVPQN